MATFFPHYIIFQSKSDTKLVNSVHLLVVGLHICGKHNKIIALAALNTKSSLSSSLPKDVTLSKEHKTLLKEKYYTVYFCRWKLRFKIAGCTKKYLGLRPN